MAVIPVDFICSSTLVLELHQSESIIFMLMKVYVCKLPLGNFYLFTANGSELHYPLVTFILITLFVLLYLVITRCSLPYLEKQVQTLGTDPVLSLKL